MADGKARRKQKYYTLKQVAPTQQAVEMAKDQIKVIKGRRKPRTTQKRGKKVGKVAKSKVKSKAKTQTRGKPRKSLVLKKGLKPYFFS